MIAFVYLVIKKTLPGEAGYMYVVLYILNNLLQSSIVLLKTATQYERFLWFIIDRQVFTNTQLLDYWFI